MTRVRFLVFFAMKIPNPAYGGKKSKGRRTALPPCSPQPHARCGPRCHYSCSGESTYTYTEFASNHSLSALRSCSSFALQMFEQMMSLVRWNQMR